MHDTIQGFNHLYEIVMLCMIGLHVYKVSKHLLEPLLYFYVTD